MSNTNRIPNGTLVQLDNRSQALAYADRDGTYRTIQRNKATFGWRVDLGWSRQQLAPLPHFARDWSWT